MYALIYVEAGKGHTSRYVGSHRPPADNFDRADSDRKRKIIDDWAQARREYLDNGEQPLGRRKRFQNPYAPHF
jgi:hypothetical protein